MTARYTLVANPPELRPEAFLLKYSLAEKRLDPTLRDPYNFILPGLYPDETAYQLDTGEEVAISVEKEWQPNGEGICLSAYGRWIEADGSTKMINGTQDVEVSFPFTFDAKTMADFTLPVLMKEMLLVILGEPPEVMRQCHVDPNAVVPHVPDNQHAQSVWFKPDETEVPVLNIPAESRAGCSIRAAIESLKALEPVVTPAELLG